MLDSELTAHLAYWQRALRLQDWTVTAKMVRYGEIGGGKGGEIQYCLEMKDALLSVVMAESYPRGERFTHHDEEQTLVHELLHLHFAPFSAKSGSPEEIWHEQTINAIASALVAERRNAVDAQQRADFANAPF